MKFNGTFELQDATREEVWLALSDPVLIERSLPGCQFLHPLSGEEQVDFEEIAERATAADDDPAFDHTSIRQRSFAEGDRYAAVLQLSVGPVNPTFETVVTIGRREFPEMAASGEGGSGDSSFEMQSWMSLTDGDHGTAVEWEAEAEVFGKIARVGQRVINPVANRVVKRFFSSVQDELADLSTASNAESARDTQ